MTAFTEDSFKKINGYSNEYWGWGGEDDDISHRMFEVYRNGFLKFVRISGPRHGSRLELRVFPGHPSFPFTKPNAFIPILSRCEDQTGLSHGNPSRPSRPNESFCWTRAFAEFVIRKYERPDRKVYRYTMFKHDHEHTNNKNPLRFDMLKHWWDFHSTDGLNVSNFIFCKQLACSNDYST